MHVLFVTGEYPPMQGGVGDYTALLSRALRAQGAETTILTSFRAASKQQTNHEDARWVLPLMRGWGAGCWRSILEAADERDVDVIHIQYQTAAYGMNPAISLLPLVSRLARRRRPRLVVTFHDLKPPYLFPKAGPLRRLPAVMLAVGADGVIVTNEEDAASLLSNPVVKRSFAPESGGHRLRLIPIGSNIPRVLTRPEDVLDWRAELGLERPAVLLSFFGFLNENKGIDLLLEALAMLGRRGRRIYLLMIGGTAGDSDPTNRVYSHRIRSLTDSPSLRERVFWTGFTRPEEVSQNLSRSDICVLPFREGGSYRHGTLVAALAHGLPIITTGASHAEVAGLPRGLPGLAHLSNCYLVPPGDSSKLAQAIEEMVADSNLRERVSQGARDLAPHFQWDRIACSALAMYEELL